MTIRTKVWLLVAASVAVTVGATSALRTYATRRMLTRQAQDAARELGNDIVRDLESFEADVDDRDLALRLESYTARNPHVQRLQLLVARESSSASSRIVALRGETPDITRVGPLYRLPEHTYTRRASDAASLHLERAVDLQGPWQATLSMDYGLGPVESMLQVTERTSLLFSATMLVVLVLVAGFITERLVVRRLETLAAAMRDVEDGNLARRVEAQSHDEIGRLGRGFNRMLDRLSSADAEIRAFSQRLAEEVQAATRDLHGKNAALAQLNRLLIELRRENASKVRLATLGQLAAQLAHEIGTPLSSVSGHLQLALLQRDLASGLRDRLQVASREIARIGKIVRDYLDSTRSLEPERKATSLRRLLQEAMEVTASTAPELTTRIRLSVDAEPVEFITDPGLLRQVIINLLSNALDAIDASGTVELTARVEANDDVTIRVRDTGSGISAEDLRRIFEPFYTTKGRGKGTGLGLAICRELVTALGGSIAVESVPGRGSTFSVRLPSRSPLREGETAPRLAAGGAA